jgi:hypothetical protein
VGRSLSGAEERGPCSCEDELMSDRNNNQSTSFNLLGGVLGVVVAILFGEWLNDVFDFGWEIPQEWISLCWIILAGSIFAMVFMILFAVIIAGILAMTDR